MASNNPTDGKGSGNPDPNNPQSKADLPEWLRTDDWLLITPPPIKRDLPEIALGRLPTSELQTDIIEMDENDDSENVEVPPSTMLFSDPDDSVVLTDDLPVSGPLSGKLESGISSIKLPIGRSEPTAPVEMDSGIDSKRIESVTNPASSGSADDSIDLSVIPTIENTNLAGPKSSGMLHPGTPPSAVTPMQQVSPEDAIGGPIAPTQPASGWLTGSANQPNVTGPDSKVSSGNSTWTELDLPSSKLLAQAKAAEPHPDSWHPSSGNLGIPSLANIDLPPEPAEGSDIFSQANRPGAPVRIDLPKPKPIRSEGPAVPPEAKAPPTPQSVSLPSTPDLPPAQPKGSWHPSSGNVMLPSTGDIDLPPPGEGSDVFSKAVKPGRSVEPKFEKPAPKPAPPEAKPMAPSLLATNFDIKTDLPRSADPASSPLITTPPPEPLDLEPTSDFKSSADIELPPEKTEGASDIFSTATKPKATTSGGSGIFSGAAAPDSSLFVAGLGRPGDSNLLADLESVEPKGKGFVDLTPPESDANLDPTLPAAKSGAINFALPPTTGGSRTSGIDVIDADGSRDDLSAISDNLHDEADALTEDGRLAAELDRQLLEDDDRPDFNFIPGMSPSDSNILGDRTQAELSRSGPHSSSVNLSDPDALSTDPAVDSGQPSSIFNKMDPAAQASDHVDLDEIPIMSSSDSGEMPLESGASAVLGGRLGDPRASDLDESVFDVEMPKDASADSGMIDWSADAAKVTDRLGMQASLEESRRNELSAASNDQPALATVRKPGTPRPTSTPDIDFSEIDAPPRSAKGRSPLLISALSLLAGAGIGAGGMFLAGGNSTDSKGTGSDPTAIAKINEVTSKLAVAEQGMVDARQQIKTLTDTNAQLKSTADAGMAAVATAKTLENEKKILEDAKKAIETEKKKLEGDFATARQKAETAESLVKKLGDEKTTLLGEVKKATDEATKQLNAAAAAKLDAEMKGKLLDSAKVAAEAAVAKLKVVDAALDPILEKFKAAKLIDDKADREKALAAIPEALKKTSLVTGESNVAAMAKELSQVRDEARKQKLEADKALTTAMEQVSAAKKEAEKQLADAKTASQKALADLQAKVDLADKRIVDEVKKAVTTATKDADAKLAALQEQLMAQKKASELDLQKEKIARIEDGKQFEAKLAERAELFEKQLAAARAGATVPLSDLATAKAEQSASAFDAGSVAYFAGKYADAEKSFAQAVKADPADARNWYFLGLSKFAQGKPKDAEADFKTGAEWENRAKPGRRVVAAALERIQGPARLALEAARP